MSIEQMIDVLFRQTGFDAIIMGAMEACRIFFPFRRQHNYNDERKKNARKLKRNCKIDQMCK